MQRAAELSVPPHYDAEAADRWGNAYMHPWVMSKHSTCITSAQHVALLQG